MGNRGIVYINGAAFGSGQGNIDTNTGGGYETLQENVTGEKNTSLGYNSLMDITKEKYNTAIGFRSGKKITGNYNTYLGSCSGYITSGAYNVGIGMGSWSTTGNYNIIIGTGYPEIHPESPSLDAFDEFVDEPNDVSDHIFNGDYNIIIGTSPSVSGSNNTLIGTSPSVSGSNNNAVGTSPSVSGSNNNTFGETISVSGSNNNAFGESISVSGSNSNAFGSKTNVFGTNSNVIGYDISSLKDNQTIIGNYITEETKIPHGYTIMNTDNYEGDNGLLDEVKLRVHGQIETDTTLWMGTTLHSGNGNEISYKLKVDPETHTGKGIAYFKDTLSGGGIATSTTFNPEIDPDTHEARVNYIEFSCISVDPALGVAYSYSASAAFDVNVDSVTHESDTDDPLLPLITKTNPTTTDIGLITKAEQILGFFKMKVDNEYLNILCFRDIEDPLVLL